MFARILCISALLVSAASGVEGPPRSARLLTDFRNDDGNAPDGLDNDQDGSHGAVSHCLLNHNQRYALLARGVRHGMAIDGCCFFYGTIGLEESRGVNITDGLISCAIKSFGGGANRIAGNHVILRNEKWELAPSTMVEGNFTEAGPWTP